MDAGQVPGHLELGQVGVLVFVDQDMREPACIQLANLGKTRKEVDCLEEKVVEIEAVRFAEINRS